MSSSPMIAQETNMTDTRKFYPKTTFSTTGIMWTGLGGLATNRLKSSQPKTATQNCRKVTELFNLLVVVVVVVFFYQDQQIRSSLVRNL